MIVGKTRIDLINQNVKGKDGKRLPNKDVPYWALYYDSYYLGTYTLEQLKQSVSELFAGRHIAYGRKTNKTHGKTGRYSVSYDLITQSGTFRRYVTFYNNRQYAIKVALRHIKEGDGHVECVDNEDGEVLVYLQKGGNYYVAR